MGVELLLEKSEKGRTRWLAAVEKNKKKVACAAVEGRLARRKKKW